MVRPGTWHTYEVGWGGWGLVMAAEAVLFWGGVIYVIVRLTRGTNSLTRRNLEPSEPVDPLAVLKRRLAAGEISVQVYDALRAVIEESGMSTSPAPAVR